jgi:hypothetical protein
MRLRYRINLLVPQQHYVVYYRYLRFLVPPPGHHTRTRVCVGTRISRAYTRISCRGAHACDVAVATHARACAWLPQPGAKDTSQQLQRRVAPGKRMGGRLCSSASAHAVNIPANYLDMLLPTGFQSQTYYGVNQGRWVAYHWFDRGVLKKMLIHNFVLRNIGATHVHLSSRYFLAVNFRWFWNNDGKWTARLANRNRNRNAVDFIVIKIICR